MKTTRKQCSLLFVLLLTVSTPVMAQQVESPNTIQPFPAGKGAWALAFDGANIWATDYEVIAGSVTKLRAGDGALLGTFRVGSDPIGITFDGANIWIANEGDNTVTKLRASDGTTLGTFSVGESPSGMTFDGENVWVANAFDGTVTKIRPSDGSVLGTFPAGSFPNDLSFNIPTALVTARGALSWGVASDGVHFDGTTIWVGNDSDATVSKLTPRQP